MNLSNLNYNCSNLLDLRNLQEQVKKIHSVTKNCPDLSLFEQIVVVISKFLNILGRNYVTHIEDEFDSFVFFLFLLAVVVFVSPSQPPPPPVFYVIESEEKYAKELARFIDFSFESFSRTKRNQKLRENRTFTISGVQF